MPVFEYVCQGCDHRFEILVLNGNSEVTCPKCQSANLRKLFSVFSSVSKEGGGSSSFSPSDFGGACGTGGCCNPGGMCGL